MDLININKYEMLLALANTETIYYNVLLFEGSVSLD
jgi:hypothetical protein